MPQRSYRQYCSLARALDVIGDRWSMLIVRNLLLGPQRWGELRDGLPGIAKNLLSSRLSQLQADTIVEHDGELYALTPRGLGLQRALFALGDWGEQHLMGLPEDEDAIRLRYLMTSMRRKLAATADEATLQLWVEEQPFSIRLGPFPRVEQGEAPSDATLRCSFIGLRALLFTDTSAAELVDGSLLIGDVDIADDLARAFRGGRAPSGDASGL